MKTETLSGIFKNAGISVFTLKDAERLTGKDMKYSSLFLSRAVKNRKLVRIGRGRYCFLNTNVYEVASAIIFPSYISLSAAFQLYGLTTQSQISVIDVITSVRHRPLEFGGYTIKFIATGKKHLFGFSKFKNENIIAASPEKAIVDAIYFGMPAEAYVYEALSNGIKRGLIDRARLLEFAEKMSSKTTLKKIREIIKEVDNDNVKG